MNNKLKNVVVVLASILVITLILDIAKTELADWLTKQFVQEHTTLVVKK